MRGECETLPVYERHQRSLDRVRRGIMGTNLRGVPRSMGDGLVHRFGCEPRKAGISANVEVRVRHCRYRDVCARRPSCNVICTTLGAKSAAACGLFHRLVWDRGAAIAERGECYPIDLFRRYRQAWGDSASTGPLGNLVLPRHSPLLPELLEVQA